MIDKKPIKELISKGIKPADVADVLSCSLVSVYRLKNDSADKCWLQKHPGEPPQTARTPALIKSVKSIIKSNPVRSMRNMAKEAGVSKVTIKKIIKDDLKAKSRARTRPHLITDSDTKIVFQQDRASAHIAKKVQK